MNVMKRERASQQLTQSEMAKRLHVSYSHYTKLEGEFVNPSFKVLQRFKQEFPEVDMNNFFKTKKA